jgi:hypothetical protein
MYRGDGREYTIKLSQATGDVLVKEPHKIYGGEKIFEVDLEKLKTILDRNEWAELEKYKDFPIVKSVLFRLQQDRTKSYTMTFNKGWRCQQVHQIKDKVIYSLNDLFSDRKLFDQLTLRLDKTTKDADAVYSI